MARSLPFRPAPVERRRSAAPASRGDLPIARSDCPPAPAGAPYDGRQAGAARASPPARRQPLRLPGSSSSSHSSWAKTRRALMPRPRDHPLLDPQMAPCAGRRLWHAHLLKIDGRLLPSRGSSIVSVAGLLLLVFAGHCDVTPLSTTRGEPDMRRLPRLHRLPRVPPRRYRADGHQGHPLRHRGTMSASGLHAQRGGMRALPVLAWDSARHWATRSVSSRMRRASTGTMPKRG
jgi:hypothetical protein